MRTHLIIALLGFVLLLGHGPLAHAFELSALDTHDDPSRPPKDPGLYFSGYICLLKLHPTQAYVIAQVEEPCDGEFKGYIMACTDSATHAHCPQEQQDLQYLYPENFLLSVYENLHRAMVAGQRVKAPIPETSPGGTPYGYQVIFTSTW